MTSVAARARGASLALGFAIAVRQQVVYLSESRLFDNVDNAHVLRSFEGGIDDCDLFVGNRSMIDTTIDRLFELQHSYDDDKIIVSLKIKDISPAADFKRNILWRLAFSEKQIETCQIVIITASQESHFVALMPTYYLHRRKTSTHNRTHFCDSYRSMWTLHPLFAFPPEMAPFILSIAQLKGALESMRDYVKKIAQNW